jgi:hypothetical protein
MAMAAAAAVIPARSIVRGTLQVAVAVEVVPVTVTASQVTVAVITIVVTIAAVMIVPVRRLQQCRALAGKINRSLLTIWARRPVLRCCRYSQQDNA